MSGYSAGMVTRSTKSQILRASRTASAWSAGKGRWSSSCVASSTFASLKSARKPSKDGPTRSSLVPIVARTGGDAMGAAKSSPRSRSADAQPKSPPPMSTAHRTGGSTPRFAKSASSMAARFAPWLKPTMPS